MYLTRLGVLSHQPSSATLSGESFLQAFSSLKTNSLTLSAAGCSVLINTRWKKIVIRCILARSLDSFPFCCCLPNHHSPSKPESPQVFGLFELTVLSYTNSSHLDPSAWYCMLLFQPYFPSHRIVAIADDGPPISGKGRG